MAKKYIVRDGFVVVLKFTKTDGESYERRYEGNEEVTLEDDQAAQHIHKLEFSSQKDRDAALAAEKADAAAKNAAASPVDLMATMAAMLSQALANAGVAPVAAPAAPAA